MDAPVWSTLSGMTAKDVTEQAVKHAYLLKGYAWTADTLRMAAEELGRYIGQKFEYLTTAEIGLALDAGTRGDLDNKDTFVSIANMQKWIGTYALSVERTDVQQERYSERTRPKKDGPQESEEDRNRRFWQETPARLFEAVKAHGRLYYQTGDADPKGLSYDHVGAMVYDLLYMQDRLDGIPAETEAEIDRETLEWYESRRLRNHYLQTGDSMEEHRKCLLLEHYFRTLAMSGRGLEYDLP